MSSEFFALFDRRYTYCLIPMYSSELIPQVENYVSTLLKVRTPSMRRFHNLQHTVHVVEKCMELAVEYGIPEDDRLILITAAWFHDTGYVYGGTGHEEQSAKIAFEYLREFNLSPDFLSWLKNLILSTQPSAKPRTLLEEILRDADLQHLGSEDYMDWSILLKEEFELQRNTHLTNRQWNAENIAFLRAHRFHTSVARLLWEDQKQKNLLLLMEMEESSGNNNLVNS